MDSSSSPFPSSSSPSSSSLSSSPFSPSLNPLCFEIENLLRSPSYCLVQFVQLGLLLSTLLSIGLLLIKCHQTRLTMHGNLLLLFANIMAVYFVHSLGHFVCILRYRLLMFFYTNACDLLTPVWLVCLLYGPTYFYYVAYPGLHFCVMLERFRATVLAAKYEREGQRIGLCMVLVNWLFSLGFMLFVIFAALAYPDLFGHAQGVIFLTSPYNLPIFYVSIFTLCIVIFTAFCDWRITVANTRIRRATTTKSTTTKINNNNPPSGPLMYSLSRNYQLNENALAMRLILPLDSAYALLYSLYTFLLILLRAYHSSLSTVDFAYYYNLTNTLLFLYSAITMLVYIRFVHFLSRSRRRNVNTRRASQPEAKEYFRQLAAQWS